MGCFSYMCSECFNPVWSDSFSGEHVIMFLIEAGECIEWMQGQYNSYGRVFHDDLKTSQKWISMESSKILRLHYNNNTEDGLAVYHSGCYDKNCVLECSDNDPDQGWGYQEYEGKKKYRFSSEGGFAHGFKAKPVPKWTKAEEI